MFNVVTISREYGSGGAEVGRRVAELLSWELVDKQIIERVAELGKLDHHWCTQADEQSCGWWERVMAGFRSGGPEAFIGGVADAGVDRDGLQRFTARVITEAARAGNCVIVGRSSQCVLRHDPAALHVLVYAPQQEKLDRMSMRHSSERDLPALLHRMDAERSRYTRDYYGCDWSDRRLYQLCVNSTLGIGACAALIAGVVRQSQSVEAESDRQVSV